MERRPQQASLVECDPGENGRRYAETGERYTANQTASSVRRAGWQMLPSRVVAVVRRVMYVHARSGRYGAAQRTCKAENEERMGRVANRRRGEQALTCERSEMFCTERVRTQSVMCRNECCVWVTQYVTPECVRTGTAPPCC